MILILQSVAQIKALYETDKWQIIMDNCGVLMFLGAGAGAIDTHKFISELLGKMTIDTFTDGRHGQQFNSNYSKQGRDPMMPSEVRRMDRKRAIVFMDEERAVYDIKALPWETSRRTGAFYISRRLNEKSPDKGYINPVEVKVDPKTGEYLTMDRNMGSHPIREVKPDEVPEGAKVTKYTEDEFLRANLWERDNRTNVEKYYRMYMSMRVG